MAETMKVTCPNCKSILTIPDVPSISDKMLTCPVCGMRSKVAVFMQQGTGKQATDDEPTQVNFDEMDRTIGSLYIGKAESSLKKGRNTIGRFAMKTGTADVQLKNDDGSVDRYMSRSHAYITIKEGGSGLEHHLEPASPKNMIKVNGTPLDDGDVIALQWGDRLTFGHTTVLFQRPGFFEEETVCE